MSISTRTRRLPKREKNAPVQYAVYVLCGACRGKGFCTTHSNERYLCVVCNGEIRSSIYRDTRGLVENDDLIPRRDELRYVRDERGFTLWEGLWRVILE